MSMKEDISKEVERRLNDSKEQYEKRIKTLKEKTATITEAAVDARQNKVICTSIDNIIYINNNYDNTHIHVVSHVLTHTN